MGTYVSSPLDWELLVAVYCILLTFYLPHAQLFCGSLHIVNMSLVFVPYMSDYLPYYLKGI